MRGGQVEGVNVFDDHSWLVAFAGDECNTVCTGGNVARVLLDFGSCGGDIPGVFCLKYLKITDCAAVKDIPTETGDVTVIGGQGVQDPCEDPIERTTWGVIKAMY
jgi:hypothetical protein